MALVSDSYLVMHNGKGPFSYGEIEFPGLDRKECIHSKPRAEVC